ncbi:hypothetical protein CEQ90_04685 [Lewinellaceae bacterium SD302]|nr:hypothetical protein CEQ90_04685 [Lewinellaceae bacterium SD302]
MSKFRECNNPFMRYFIPFFTFLIILTVNSRLIAQREVAILKTDQRQSLITASQLTAAGISFPFLLERNQIWLEATVEAERGYFILDTGAPTLLLNDNDQRSPNQLTAEGRGAAGAVTLTEHRVNSFSLAGIEQGQQSAYLIDLDGFAKRSGNHLLGMIGHEQLKDYELLIDCKEQEMKLFPARRNELHRSARPAYTLSFTYDEHLPVITLRNGRKKLRFAIDTGAGVNLLNAGGGKLPAGLLTLEETVNVKGLGEGEQELPYAKLPGLHLDDLSLEKVDFVLADLSHLQSADGHSIDGIVGPDFLRNFRVSINFRKRKLYVW